VNLEHHIVGSHEEPCWHCGDPTDQIEIHFEAYLCPGACTAAKEAEFWEAVRTRPQEFEDPFETADERNHRCYKAYRALTGQFPPRTQHPNNSLPDAVLEALRDRQDLVDWALGR
jgi:hypothetical protein